MNAVINSSVEPDERQYEGMLAFVKSRYGEDSTLEWQFSDKYSDGFCLIAGSDVYDWSVEGRLKQLREALETLNLNGRDAISLVRDRMEHFSFSAEPENLGTVISVGDGIAQVSGLMDAQYGEILIFEDGVRGMALNLSEDSLGCILFDDENEISSGTFVQRTGKTAGIPVGEGFLGRVINSLGVPLDGMGDIKAKGYRTIEHPAPAIIDRQSVNQPLETGLLAVDSVFPIGRGQRELIIGDRQTGKTAIAVDTIINQKDKDVICIYVSIGQKNSSVAQLADTLKKHGAMDYTIIVHSSAGDAAPLQYIAPYAGCAMGEYFMSKGKDVLIVYDDLSKHAVAYRALSLLLGRAPGREAYPGDVFYLHSRLLERLAHLSNGLGGGSMTALPIVETQAGDISAYIPTNIISITDGQIFLESDLFFAGQRPAVNVGISVSRVGGDAQTKAMKKAVGTLKLDLAQYREMEIFSQFASDLDESTKKQLAYGQGLMRILRQKQYHPYSMSDQVILLTAALSRAFTGVPDKDMEEAKEALLEHFHEKQAGLCSRIAAEKVLEDADRELIKAEAASFMAERNQIG